MRQLRCMKFFQLGGAQHFPRRRGGERDQASSVAVAASLAATAMISGSLPRLMKSPNSFEQKGPSPSLKQRECLNGSRGEPSPVFSQAGSVEGSTPLSFDQSVSESVFGSDILAAERGSSF